MSIEARLKELGIELPAATAALANYVPFVQEGNLIVISGQVPWGADGKLAFIGKLGKDMEVDEGYQAARVCALYCLAQLQAAAGSLDKVKRIVRVGGFVNCTGDFTQQPQVVNGASDVIVEIMGDKGRHARAAIGTSGLPGGVAVEVEMMAALD